MRIKKPLYLTISSILILVIVTIMVFNRENNNPDNLPEYKIYDVPDNLTIKKPKDNIVRILVIDGGGMRGIIPLHILQYIEQKTGKPIYQLFDLIGGSSTGALIAVGLTIPDNVKPSQPLLNSTKLLYLYNNKIKFKASLFRRILTVNGIYSPLFDGEDIKEQIWNAIKVEPLFNDLLTNVVIATYSLSRATPVIFQSWHKKLDPYSPVYRAIDIAVAAGAVAPFLPPSKIKSVDGKYSDTLIDPITILPNPSVLALTEAMSLYPNSKFVVLSLGTGTMSEFFASSTKLGLFGWVNNSYTISSQGLNWIFDRQLETIFRSDPKRFLQYLRINIPMNNKDFALALSTESGSIKTLNYYGKKNLQANQKYLEKFIDKWLVER